MIKDTIAVIGLGYVGLPLAIEFSKKYSVIGYDIDKNRVDDLKNGYDKTLEVSSQQLQKSNNLFFTCNEHDLKIANIFIITVPTPIDINNKPDIHILLKASEMVGKIISKGNIVIYESTVYPGCTEEECVPIIEKFSGLIYNKNFFCGYSPERINPGDKKHTLTKIVKVTSGSNTQTADKVDSLYKSIVTAGTHKVSSIKIAEAAKIIENCQRDINIAFVNELAMLFNKLEIDTKEVLDASKTKWNFLDFNPGLVGGHCIGVDPYYLTYLAKKKGYDSKIILAGRKLNDSMPKYITTSILELMGKNNLPIKFAEILILGITFKENCPDIRNSKVIEIYNIFKNKEASLTIHDPYADFQEVKKTHNITLSEFDQINNKKYDVIIIAVNHEQYKDLKIDALVHKKSVIYDLKSIYTKKYSRL